MQLDQREQARRPGATGRLLLNALIDNKTLDSRSQDVILDLLKRELLEGGLKRRLQGFDIGTEFLNVEEVNLRFGDEREEPVLQLPHLLCRALARSINPKIDPAALDAVRDTYGRRSVVDFTKYVGDRSKIPLVW